MFRLSFRLSLVLMLLLAGCAEEPIVDTVPPLTTPVRKIPHQAPPRPQVRAPAHGGDEFIVRKGDTLYSIGFGSGLGYELLAEWNDIPKPYKLQVGQAIKLYDPALPRREQTVPVVHTPPLPTRPSVSPKTPPHAPAKTVPPPAKPAKIQVVDAVPPPKSNAATARKTTASTEQTRDDSKDKQKVLKLRWRWPIEGKVLKNFVQSGGKGIDIAGKAGDPVRAAANGEVVYSGNGLIGYGNLLIIKHDDVYLSAYANNAALQVNENDKVSQGQVIARCGKSATGVPSVHFEIRKHGKSVNPLHYLP